MAWKIAAGETATAKHQYIEKEHIFIGICSLEKVLMLDSEKIGLNPQAKQALQAEHNAVEALLKNFNLNPTQLRHQVREKLGEGNYEHTEKVIHRSEACKNVFKRANELATEGEVSCLHLLAAILEEGDVIGSVLNEAGVKPVELRERVRAHTAMKLEHVHEPVHQEEFKTIVGGAYRSPDNLSLEAKQILSLAEQESSNLKHLYLGTEHIFIALTMVENGITEVVFKHLNLDQKQIIDAIRKTLFLGDGEKYWKGFIVTPRCQTILRLAEEEAVKRKSQIEDRDLLLGILKEGGGIPVRVLKEMKISISEIIMLIAQGKVKAGEKKIHLAEKKNPITHAKTMLEKYGRDLTQLAREGKLEKVIGRTDEILELVRTLTRKTKNAPLLVGEAGVGKTAIVEGLAIRIISGNITPELIGKRIIELNMASLIAGTKYRGEFEERLVGIIKEASNPEIILFIDEIHTLVGAGAAEGAIDASNILKPALARGEIRCIGATTIKEYRKYIEKDSALERRFQPITVKEPDIEDAKKILEGLREKYEKHHHVKITNSAIKAAVELSARYLLDRRLPDKAIDLLDRACTRKKVPILSMHGKIPEGISMEVSDEDIAVVLAEWTGLPVKKLTEEEQQRFTHMEDAIQERVIGQNDAVEKVSRRIRMAKAGLLSRNHPVGVFLFLGPTGVGKTELAKALSAFLFGSERVMIRIDMSEYMEKHSISRLIGAPPGYIGHDEEGQLTGALRTKPYSVVLLDEFEKAHHEVFDIFLQVFDEGRLTDSKGRTIDAKNAIFIMTSNIGSEVYFKGPEIPYGVYTENHREEMLRKVKSVFRPEFLNRIDELILFKPLSREDIYKIAQIILESLSSRLKEKGISLQVTQNAIDLICRKGYDPANGARPMQREIERMVVQPLSEKILKDDLTYGDAINIDTVGDEIKLKKEARN